MYCILKDDMLKLERVLDELGVPKRRSRRYTTPYRKTIAASQGLLRYEQDGISIRHANGVEEILAHEAYETLARREKNTKRYLEVFRHIHW